MIVYFHGLESPQGGPKVEWMIQKYGEVYAPDMNYQNNPNSFNDAWAHLKKNRPDVIIGSSMGGYFAYYMGKLLGVPVLLLNPALPYRTFNPAVNKTGSKKSYATIVLGKRDLVIKPDDTLNWLDQNESPVNYEIQWGNHGHRTPEAVFKKYVNYVMSDL